MRGHLLGLVTVSAMALANAATALDRLDFSVSGGGGSLEDRLRASSLLVESEATDVDDIQELLAAARADYGRLIGALYNRGHFGAVINILIDGIEAAQISPLEPPAQINVISVQITAGLVYRFSRAEIGPLAPGTIIDDAFEIGDDARSPIIRDAAQAAISQWRDVGHAKANIGGQQVIADHDTQMLDVKIDVAPGPRVRFGELLLDGNETVRANRLREIAGLPTGQVFSPKDLGDVERRLQQTGVFSSVALSEAETLGPGDTLDITALLAEQKPRRIGFGGEYATTDGFAFTGYWLHRNLLGGAERFRVDGEAKGFAGMTGGIDYIVTARFDRPATFGPDRDFFIETSLAFLNEPEFESDSFTINAGFNERVNDQLRYEYGLGYRFSKDTDDTGSTEFSLLTLPLKAIFDSRDEPLDATEGYFASTALTPFLGINSSTDSGGLFAFDGRVYRALGAEKRIVLAARVQAGSIFLADLKDTPNDFRFFSGGGDTVRGQEYQDLTVELDGGGEGGGASFFGVQSEIRGNITDALGLVGFYDFGMISADSFPFTDPENHSGAGLGVRYDTPIGPIRLDVGVPLDRGSGVEVYIGVGQAF